MKRKILFTILTIYFSLSSFSINNESNLLLLDNSIKQRSEIQKVKQKKISLYISLLQVSKGDQLFRVYTELHKQYISYRLDSAMYYAQASYDVAKQNNNEAEQSLSNLTFTSFPNVLDSICELYAEAPAGYIYGSLRKNLKDVMRKAAIVASKQLKDNKVRDLPSFNIKYPIVKIDKNGKFIFHKSLSWTIYENADDEHPVVKTMPSASKTNAQVIQPQNNAFDLFSGYFSENSFENSSDELEALYYIWVIATKLIINGNVIPQLYTPKENTFAVRWIPVIFNPSIAKIINEVANNLQHINIQLLSTPTDNGEINNHDLALARSEEHT